MTLENLAIGLVISLLGTAAAGLIALFPDRRAHRISNVVLSVSAVIGALVGITVATGDNLLLVLPEALYPNSTGIVWPLFYNMVFGLDRFSSIFFSIISVVTVLTSLFAIPYLESRASAYNLRSANAVTALFILGMQGVVLSTNIVGFMTFWELMSISSFFLVLADGSAASRKAGFLYLVFTQLGAAAIAAGLFLLSGGALLSDFSVLAIITPQLPALTIGLSLGLLLFGFGSKVGLVPFHVWLPEANAAAPTHAAALMSGVMLNVALYGFLRVLLFILPGIPTWFVLTIIVLGVLSAVVGVLYTVLERDVKRLMAYSSIETMGLVFCMVGVGLLAGQEGSAELTQAALYAALYLAIAHAVFKAGLFYAVGALIGAVHTRNLELMGGLAKRMPQFSVAVCVLILAAASMPPFGSFIAEWTFMQSMTGALLAATPILKIVGVTVLAATAFVAGLSLFAMVKLYSFAFLAQPRSEQAAVAVEPVTGLMVPIVAAGLISLLLGLFSPLAIHRLGAIDLTLMAQNTPVLAAGGSSLAPVLLFIVMLGVMGALVLLRRLLTKVSFERVYQTWDGGQPTTSRMEYTATGFSAPVRFFFRFLLRAQKVVIATPAVTGNPWVANRVMTLDIRQVWYDRLYAPAAWALLWLSSLAGKLQNGSIQFYVSLILVALFVTLIVAL